MDSKQAVNDEMEILRLLQSKAELESENERLLEEVARLQFESDRAYNDGRKDGSTCTEEYDLLASGYDTLKNQYAQLQAEFRAAGSDVDLGAEYGKIIGAALAHMKDSNGPDAKREVIRDTLDKGYSLGVRAKDRELRVAHEAAHKAQVESALKVKGAEKQAYEANQKVKDAELAVNQMRDTNERLTRQLKGQEAPLLEEIAREKAKYVALEKRITLLEGNVVQDWPTNAAFLSNLIEQQLIQLGRIANNGVASTTTAMSQKVSALAAVLRMKADYLEESAAKILVGEPWQRTLEPTEDRDRRAERLAMYLYRAKFHAGDGVSARIADDGKIHILDKKDFPVWWFYLAEIGDLDNPGEYANKIIAAAEQQFRRDFPNQFFNSVEWDSVTRIATIMAGSTPAKRYTDPAKRYTDPAKRYTEELLRSWFVSTGIYP